jgi:uncharacterized protein (DUF2141 family)
VSPGSWTYAAISGIENPGARIPRGIVCVALFAVLAFASLPARSHSPCPGIHVKVLNIRNSTGGVACALFESRVGFPKKFLVYATNIMIIKIRESRARWIPTGWECPEGYGFSRDARGILGAPSFDAASFVYDGQNLDLVIGLNY